MTKPLYHVERRTMDKQLRYFVWAVAYTIGQSVKITESVAFSDYASSSVVHWEHIPSFIKEDWNGLSPDARLVAVAMAQLAFRFTEKQ